MENIRQQYEDIFDKLGEHFYVKSWISEQSKVIFILESPHIEEVKYGAPVSGRSGTTMSKHLFGPEYNKPLGRLVIKNIEEQKNRPALDAVGLMNICGIPMQRKAYGDRNVTQAYQEFFDVLEGVRQGNQKDVYPNEAWNVMQEVILDRFRERLAKQQDKKCVLVPCGRFAQKFFRLADMDSHNWKVIDGVPHPSYNSWDRERYQPAVRQVQKAFERGREVAAEGNGS
ncbi:MAG TPA: uracil-DNA glycosylase family protein [Bacillales bacterium]